jgi:ornithine decarboxylase
MIRAIDISEPSSRNSCVRKEFLRIGNFFKNRPIKTPFFILSRSSIRKNLTDLAQALPGVAIHYAVKSNNHRAILEEVINSGHSFDIASYRELQSTLEAGGRVDNLIHSHPVKSAQEIESAIAAGATLFVVDNPNEIEKFTPYAGKVRLLIRFKVTESDAVVNLSFKFGCEPDEVLCLAEKIKSLGIEYYGLTFHVGSQCINNKGYIGAIKAASGIIRQLSDYGFKTKLLDIGGGFPVTYTDSVPSIDEFCRPINDALKENIDTGISLACEPGRFISASAATLAASVIGKSIRSGRPWYFLDDGLYGSFSGRLYDHCQYQVLTNRNTTWKHSVLAGPTCDSFDVVYKDVILPPLEVNDILLFPAMGAYCSVSASSFNCLKGAEYIVVD